MTTYDEAVSTILDYTGPLEIEEKPLFQSVGQVLAEDGFADDPVPRTDRSGPDGYATRAAGLKGATRENPVVLRVVGTARAGVVSKRMVEPGTAIRIMTGSVVPIGADCVVPFEDTDEPLEKNGPNPANPRTVKVFTSVEAGAHIGPAGFSARKGSLVVRRGSLIGPAQVSALTTIGKARVRVIRRPVVAIIATGDELVQLGRWSLRAGQVYNSNTAAVAALVSHFGGTPKILGIARDRKDSLLSKLRQATKADAIVTTGGVSKGDYDIVRLLLGEMGRVVFSRIVMGPGASVAFGLVKGLSVSGEEVDKPLFALSGPPTGSLINCETLVRPGILKMRGLRDVRHPVVCALAADSVPRAMPKAFVRWTRLTKTAQGYQVVLNPIDGKGPLAAMASANSLTIVPKGATVKPGDPVDVLPLDWMGIQNLVEKEGE
jgi:molybdopterin molybdotransferase